MLPDLLLRRQEGGQSDRYIGKTTDEVDGRDEFRKAFQDKHL